LIKGGGTGKEGLKKGTLFCPQKKTRDDGGKKRWGEGGKGSRASLRR